NIFSESKLLNIDDNNKSLIKEKYLEKIKINPDSSNAELITELYEEMIKASQSLNFEYAAELRDLIKSLK
ncbi:UvrB/UvrC motif-containing protein, partial [Candidatus Dependentiae bacterium]|nr:UvrB/UvrC motif-containing protein [Candidatus Dependentiae bacterium]